jgi:hypothetical protein
LRRIRTQSSSSHGSVSFNGAHYRVGGIEPGPEPAYKIQIWLGAQKPRMLRLIARKADGWLISLFRKTEADLAEGNAIIDRAAAAGGRDPREIRRLVNIRGSFSPGGHGFLQGTPADWIQDLLPFAIKHGFGTFILASDDPGQIETYAQEVVPTCGKLSARSAEKPAAARNNATTARGRLASAPRSGPAASGR